MDRWRPGWRERAAKRKSLWNFIGLVLGLAMAAVCWYYLFRGAWHLHVQFYPAHAGHFREFWGNGISGTAFVSSFLMMMPLFVPALIGGALVSNVVLWCLPPARRAMEREAAGDREMTFAGANAGLLRWGGLVSAICLLLSFIGLSTLTSLR